MADLYAYRKRAKKRNPERPIIIEIAPAQKRATKFTAIKMATINDPPLLLSAFENFFLHLIIVSETPKTTAIIFIIYIDMCAGSHLDTKP